VETPGEQALPSRSFGAHEDTGRRSSSSPCSDASGDRRR
jgi:hypothetical protein